MAEMVLDVQIGLTTVLILFVMSLLIYLLVNELRCKDEDKK